jgi:hypothetical protein
VGIKDEKKTPRLDNSCQFFSSCSDSHTSSTYNILVCIFQTTDTRESMAPGSPPPVLPQRRHDLDVAKQQLVCIVTIIATLFVLCPERYQLYRNLAVIPVIAYVTSRTFDLIISLNEKWDRAPAVVKYFVPVQIPEIAPPTEQLCCLVKNQITTAGDKVHQFSLQLRSMVRALLDWILRQTGQGK